MSTGIALSQDLRDADAAMVLVEIGLAIRKRVLGPEHPDAVATRRALEELEG